VGKESYFSISSKMIVTDEPLDHDLFINSSGLESRTKFVRVFPKGDVLSSRDVDSFIKKYHQLYVPEEQREAYFKSLVKSEQFDDVEATKVIKDNAIGYLQNLFDDQKEFNTELLSETVEQCRDAVEGMIDVLDDYDIGSLQGLIGDLSAHDFYTYDHSINVSMYCISILRGIKPDATRQELLHAGLGGLFT
jgi:HD-GYP domain-containing protein (c-di-GMP phosphodiesterase class II)